MTSNQKWLSRKYLAYQMLTNFWFVGAVWLYFYRIFVTDQQVGILDAAAFTIGLLAEVPSGALADKFGRDRMVRLGQMLTGAGLLVQVVGSSFFWFVVGQSIMMIGISLVSGADEALFFEQLGFDRKSVNWRKLVTRGSQAALIASVSATLIGGWLHSIDPRIPWVLNGLTFIAAALLIWNVKDTRPKKERQKFMAEVGDYLKDIKTGFAQFRLPKLWLYVPIIITVQGLFYTTGFGILRLILLSRFDFNPFWGSVAIASSGLITVWLLHLMHKYAERMSERRVITLIALSAAASLLLALANIGMWGYVVIFALYAGEHVLYPFMSEILNNNAPENQRATVLSVGSFFKTLPYVLLAPLIGYLNTHGQLDYFLIGWAVLICLATALYLANKKRDSHIKLQEELA
jgi:MFS family permease